MTTPQKPRWIAVIVLGLAAFVVVSAEFLPVGILPAIAADSHVPLGYGSLIVLIPGLVAGVSAPLIVTGIRRLDRKTLVLTLVAVLFVSDLASWLVHGFLVLLACRLLLGLALGGFWAIGPSFGARLAPARPAVAVSIVVAGISAGTVLALPLGALIETSAGWRVAFAFAAGLSFIVLALVVIVLPAGTTADAALPRQLLAVLKDREPRLVLILTAIAVPAQFVGSTFIGALLDRNFSEVTVPLLLLIYGVVGLGANLVAPRLGVTMPQLLTILSVVMTLIFAAFALAGHLPLVALIGVVVWGALWGVLPLIFQTWMISSVPKAPEAGSALLVTVIQLSIAAGSALGGFAIGLGGLPLVYGVGAVLFLIAFCVVILSRRNQPAQAVPPEPLPAKP
jgi:predicted MFS family arabinose efflux permease